jgi:hypothetical protein
MKNKIIQHAMRAEMAAKLSKRINQTLTIHSLKLYELADLLEVNATTLSKWKMASGVPRSYDLYKRVMDEMRDINEAARANTTPVQGGLFHTPLSASIPDPVRVDPNVQCVTTGIAEYTAEENPQEIMERAADMYNTLVGGPAMTPQQGHSFLSILKMLRAQ